MYYMYTVLSMYLYVWVDFRSSTCFGAPPIGMDSFHWGRRDETHDKTGRTQNKVFHCDILK